MIPNKNVKYYDKWKEWETNTYRENGNLPALASLIFLFFVREKVSWKTHKLSDVEVVDQNYMY